MIYRRVVVRLRAQEWTAIAIEVGIVIGTWVANWNQSRIERADLDQIIDRLSGDGDGRLLTVTGNHQYYETTGRDHHQASIASYLFNVDQYAVLLTDVARRLAFRGGAQ